MSVLLLAEKDDMRNWALDLLRADGGFEDVEKLLDCVIAAIGGHHLKLDEEWQKASIAFRDGGCWQSVQTFLTHENLKPLFSKEVTQEICLDLIKNKANSLHDKHIPFKFSSNKFKDTLKNNLD